jgi:hypothetical protein
MARAVNQRPATRVTGTTAMTGVGHGMRHGAHQQRDVSIWRGPLAPVPAFALLLPPHSKPETVDPCLGPHLADLLMPPPAPAGMAPDYLRYGTTKLSAAHGRRISDPPTGRA